MKKRSIAFLLSLVMLLSLLTPTALAEEPDQEGQATEERTEIPALSAAEVAVPREAAFGDETTVTAPEGAESYQWQFRLMEDLWVNISGDESAAIVLTYAKVCNMLDESGAASLRCLVDGAVSETLTVTVTDEPAQEPDETPVPDEGPVLDEEPVIQPVLSVLDPQQSAEDTIMGVSNSAVGAQEETGDEEDTGNEPAPPSTYTILINYQFADGTQAAPSWSATVAAGSTYTQDIQSPTVVGYEPDQEKVEVDVTNIQADKTYTVTYKPALVEFTVKHYQQNVSNDQYMLVSTETKKGFTESPVGANLATTYEGFYSLLYDTTTKIAADGSTEVEIYYDRYYYLMSFDLDGGYGVEPIYAKYGTDISIGTPSRAGYRFVGWLDADNKVNTVLPYTKMPAENTSFKAVWEAGEAAKVTIVVWGEKADSEDYDYYRNAEIQAKPGEKLTINDLQGKLICGKEEHTHYSDSCGIKCDHTHSLTCYGLSANASTTSPNDNTAWWCDSKPETYFARLGLEDGCLYYDDENAALDSKDNYYLRFGGKYYELSKRQFNKLKDSEIGKTSDNTSGNPDYYYKYSIKASGMSCSHTHDDSCYACGKPEHTHTTACYYNTSFMENPNLWKLVRSDEVTVAADGTTIINVYYDRVEFTLHFRAKNSNSDNYGTIKAKWGANIRNQFNAKCTLAGTSNWSEKPGAGGPWTSYLDIMPEKDMTFYANTKGYGTSTAYYYVEGLDGKDELYYTNVSTGTGYTVTVEEFIDIDGFTFNAGRSAKVGADFNGAKFYYTRNSYTLKFFNRTEELTDKAKTVKYEAPLKDHYFEPAYPSDLEPNAYVFAGWYTTAGCYEGSEADLSNMTMPASDVILYAKWTPKTHTVKTYLTKDVLDKGEAPLETWAEVPHGTAVTNPPKDPDRDPYKFVGWFYISDTGEEKAFDFSMPVNRDLNLYAKWSSNALMEYTIRYELEDGTEIAPPTTGSALAGTTKTFDAKTGMQLNEDYQSGYFPKVSSHSLTLDIDDLKKNEFTFIYEAKPEVVYTVKYLEKGTEKQLAEPKTVTTRDAVVTETFKQIKGYAPDAYQKQLVLAAEGNEIIFWYVKDEVHAPVQVIHWTQNIVGDGYTEYQSSSDLNGVIGTEYSESPLTIPGFRYNGTKSNAKDTLTAAGLVLNLYYDRIEYPYEFRFLEQGTDKELAPPVSGSARYQAQVTQGYKIIPGYTLVSAENQAINIAIEDPANVANKNVKTFYYSEQTVEIKYEVVGPTGCGTLDNYQEAQLKVITGTVKGSAPTAAAGFKFVGWYKDEACTQPVDGSWVVSNKLTPGKTKDLGNGVMGYEAATYYAKFEPDVADLTISKQGCEAIDENQSFIFTVTGAGLPAAGLKVVVTGNGSVTIKGLKVGTTYTITEDTGWSWRYTPTAKDGKTAEPAQDIKLQAEVNGYKNTVTFNNSRTQDKWLNGCSIEVNNWKKKADEESSKTN